MIRRLLGFLILGIMAIISVNFFLTLNESWASNLEKAILGKWRNMQSEETLEFFEDGTIIVTEKDDNEDKQMVGNYRVLDETRVRIDLAGWYQLGGPQVWPISVANDILVLSIANEKREFRKVTKEMQIFLDGLTLYENKKFDEAAKLFTVAAEQGEIEAQDKLASMYYKGQGVEKNDQIAFKWSHEAAKHGSMLSQRNLGMMYNKGLGVEKDIEKAIYWLQKAADHEYIEAYMLLGWIYATSENPKFRNAEEALKYARIAYSKASDEWPNLSTLAAAYARSGEFGKAVNTMKLAINIIEQNREMSYTEKEKRLDEAKILLKLYENNSTYDGFDLDEVIAREKEERAKPNIPDSDFDATAWTALSKGEKKGDFHFREDNSLYYEDELLTSKLSGEEVDDPTIYKFKAEKLIISKPSPSKRYTFIKVCENDNFFDQLYLLDAKNKTLKPIFAGKYGPREAIYWAPDERYATLKYYDEGYLFHYYVDLATALSFEREVMTLDELGKVMDEHSRLALDTIRKNWQNPAAKNKKQTATAAVVDITVKKDGKISNVWFKHQSNFQAINDAAWKAIKKSDPLPALPGEFPGSSKQLTFYFAKECVSLFASINKEDYPALLKVLLSSPLYDSMVTKKVREGSRLYQKGYPSGNTHTIMNKGDVLTLVEAYPNDGESKYTLKVKYHNDQEGYCLSKFVELLETNDEKGDILAIHLAAPYEFEGDVVMVDEWIKKYQDFVRKYPEGQYVLEAMLIEAKLHLYCLKSDEKVFQKNNRLNRIIEIINKLKTLSKEDFFRNSCEKFSKFLDQNAGYFTKSPIDAYVDNKAIDTINILLSNVSRSVSYLDEVERVR